MYENVPHLDLPSENNHTHTPVTLFVSFFFKSLFLHNTKRNVKTTGGEKWSFRWSPVCFHYSYCGSFIDPRVFSVSVLPSPSTGKTWANIAALLWLTGADKKHFVNEVLYWAAARRWNAKKRWSRVRHRYDHQGWGSISASAQSELVSDTATVT